MRNFILSLSFFIFLIGCGPKTIPVIPIDDSPPLTGQFKQRIGAATLTIKMHSGEILTGDLVWLIGGTLSTAYGKVGDISGTYSGMTTANTGVYKGVLVGAKGTKMTVEIEVHAFTGKGVGIGITNDGQKFQIILP